MPDLAAAYHDARITMSKLAREADRETLSRTVPACPDWTIHDLISHVTSIASELSGGTFPLDLNLVAIWDPEVTRRREEWVAQAVESRRSRSIEDILSEWEEGAARIDPMLRGEAPFPDGAPPIADWAMITDIGIHLHDLRGALGKEGDRDSLATGLALRSYVEAMRFRSAHEGLPPFQIRAGSRQWTIGEGEPVATVTADPWELARAASGRRSPDQIRAYEWEGDPEPFITLFYPYGARADALHE